MRVVRTAGKNHPSNRASLDCTARTQRSVSVYIPVCIRPASATGRARAGENPTSTSRALERHLARSPRGLAQQPQSVEADEDRGALVPGDTEREREVAEEVPQDEPGDEGTGDHEVLDDQPAGGPGQAYDRGDGRELVPYDDRVRRLQREVGARTAHRDAGVGGGEGRRVVDPVPDEEHLAPGVLKLSYGVHLALGQQVRADVHQAGGLGYPRGGPGVVTGEQDGRRAGQGGERGGGGRGLGAEAVGEGEGAEGDAVAGHQDDGVAVLGAGDGRARRVWTQ